MFAPDDPNRKENSMDIRKAIDDATALHSVDGSLVELVPREQALWLADEVDRLRAAIEEHEWGYAAVTREEQREKNRRLWAVLDES